MLVLTRRPSETIFLNFSKMTDAELLALRTLEPIRVTVVEIRGDKVRLGFNAPDSVKVNRSEIN
jgi:sRNA-binding carbon storage regulator CsrA